MPNKQPGVDDLPPARDYAESIRKFEQACKGTPAEQDSDSQKIDLFVDKVLQVLKDEHVCKNHAHIILSRAIRRLLFDEVL